MIAYDEDAPTKNGTRRLVPTCCNHSAYGPTDTRNPLGKLITSYDGPLAAAFNIPAAMDPTASKLLPGGELTIQRPIKAIQAIIVSQDELEDGPFQ